MSVAMTTPPPAFCFSADLLRVVFTCADFEDKPNYAVRFRLFIQLDGSTSKTEIYNTRLPVLPGSSDVHAYIGDKLHDYISADIDLNGVEYPSGSHMQCGRSCRAYHFVFCESYGEDIEDHAETTSADYTVLHGGLSYFAQYSTTLAALINPATAAYDRFLSQASDRQSVRVDQPQYLYFFNARELTPGVSLNVNYHYSDGSSSIGTLATLTLQASQKYAFDISVSALDPEAGKTLASYDVSLWSGTNRRSEVRTFIVDRNHRDFVRYFLHWSSWGTLDVKACFGYGTSGMEITQKTATRILPQGFDIRSGQRVVFDVRGSSVLTVATGWLDRSMLRIFRDFFLSRLKYRLRRGQLMPIQIDTTTIEMEKDGEQVVGYVFEYRYLYEEHAYTEGDVDEPGVHFDGFTFSENVEWSALTDNAGNAITDNEGNQITLPQ